MPRIRIPRDRCSRAHLPSVCVVSGATDVEWHLIVHRPDPASPPVVFELPFARGRRERWLRGTRWLTVAAFVVVIVGVVLMGVGQAAASEHPSKLMRAASFIVGIPGLIALLALIGGRISALGPRLVQLEPGAFTFEIPNEAAVRAIEERLAVPPETAPPPSTFRCPGHAEPFAFTCGRCGNFACERCRPEAGSPVCADCWRRTVEALETSERRQLSVAANGVLGLGVLAALPLAVPLQIMAIGKARGVLARGRALPGAPGRKRAIVAIGLASLGALVTGLLGLALLVV